VELIIVAVEDLFALYDRTTEALDERSMKRPEHHTIETSIQNELVTSELSPTRCNSVGTVR